jgi:hypothetical protein
MNLKILRRRRKSKFASFMFHALLYPEIIQKLSARNNLLLQFFFYNMKLQLKPTTLRGFYVG